MKKYHSNYFEFPQSGTIIQQGTLTKKQLINSGYKELPFEIGKEKYKIQTILDAARYINLKTMFFVIIRKRDKRGIVKSATIHINLSQNNFFNITHQVGIITDTKISPDGLVFDPTDKSTIHTKILDFCNQVLGVKLDYIPIGYI